MGRQLFLKTLGGYPIDGGLHAVDGSPNFTCKGEASLLQAVVQTSGKD